MRKLVLFMHCSLDGFVAGPKGEMDWIKIDENMFDIVGKCTDESDAALYGRVTFQMMDQYWPDAGKKPDASRHDKQHSDWYNKVKKVILSKTLKPTGSSKNIIIGQNVAEEVNKIKSQEGRDILIFGSPTASHYLMSEKLIDDFWLLINPILLGQGIPLFKDIKEVTRLKLLTCTVLSSGVVCAHYHK
jgi:dihydrofolate reductase